MRGRIAEISDTAPGSIGDMLHFRLLECDPEQGEYTFSCRTELWMRNVAGTLHGGLCATVLDQAMGIVSYCLKPGDGTAPAIQLKADFHRSLCPGQDIVVKVQVVSVTNSLMHLTAQAMQPPQQEKICMSGSGIYFYKRKRI